jgi:hypothetical protein
MHHVGNAKQSLARVQAESGAGRWATSEMSQADSSLVAAWYLLASDEAREEMEAGNTDVFEWKPYSGFSLQGAWSEISKDAEELWELFKELKEHYDCLMKVTQRLKVYRLLLIALYNLIDTASDLDDPQGLVTFDVPATERLLIYMRDRLQAIYDQMNDTIENDRRYTAPIQVENWKNEIWSHLLLLRSIGESTSMTISWSNLWGDDFQLAIPFQAETYKLSEQGVTDLAHIMLPHDPASEGSVTGMDLSVDTIQSILSGFISTMGNVGKILLNHEGWVNDIAELKSRMNSARVSDSKGINLLDQFSDYGCDQFDFLKNFLQSSGLDDAYKSLVSGRIPQIMEIASVAQAVTSVATCMGAHLSAFGLDLASMDEALAYDLEDRMTQADADAKVRVRSSLALPAFQFKFVQGLTEKLSDLTAEIEYLNTIVPGVCT